MKRKIKVRRTGQKRTRRKFLLWPRSFGGDWRWLEWANVREQQSLVLWWSWWEVGFEGGI